MYVNLNEQVFYDDVQSARNTVTKSTNFIWGYVAETSQTYNDQLGIALIPEANPSPSVPA